MNKNLNVEGSKFLSATQAGKFFGYTKNYLLMLIREGKIDGKKIQNKWYVHLPSAEGFFEHAREKRTIRQKQVSAVRKKELKAHALTRKHHHRHTALLETLAIVIIGLSLGATAYLGTTPQSAVVSGANHSFLENTALSLYALVSSTDSTTTPQSTTSLVVFPEGDTSSTTLSSIADAFSDPVDVSIDPENPQTGIITPQFRDRSGEAYRFLMVPVTPTE